MGQYHGNPCWYELGTSDLDAAKTFYGKVLGWTTSDSGMEGFTYLLASAGDQMIAGMMSTAGIPGDPPPYWMIYFGVSDADKAAADIQAAGGQILRAPEDIPGTGRFAIVTDPQGAGFGILQPDMSQMTPEQIAQAEQNGPFDQSKPGHGNWHELMSTDPIAGFDFYAELLGWTKSKAMDMGEMGTYQLFARQGQDIGGMMGLGNSPVPCWLPYFGVEATEAAIARIRDAGGTVHHGPVEVPGGAHVAIAQDPQGAMFAVVGASK